MDEKRSAFRGCLLGLAVGDAMGYTVDDKSWNEIQEDYGPNGLLGYDLINGYADVTSKTQNAANACNGLLLATTRGQMQGAMAPFVRYLGLSLREWAQSQRYRVNPGRICCWLARVREVCARRCMDTLMLDTLNREKQGSLEAPLNKFLSPGAMTAAVPVGLFANSGFCSQGESLRLAAETVALTHGHPAAFLSGAVVAQLISDAAKDRKSSPEALVQQAIDAVQCRFGLEYPQTVEIWELLRLAMTLAKSDGLAPVDAMEKLGCRTAPEVLAGSIYAWLVSGEDFDTAIITAVNHSGRSAAVGAITGAILGARLGEEALPDFYLDCLEPTEVLRELADDLAQGCPMDLGSAMFDDDWDRKYIHGGM